ncbi:DNA-formamidopyrimidine glycosylase [Microgenomates bacterium UTCPR1]|nr:MAG: DNA-formamidopyrimidine glycosylase [Microgenomates bacterium UTCPR1]
MPELPEVETIKRNLEPNVIGKIISDIKMLSPKNFIGNKNYVIGRKIIDVKRYGKVLVIKLSTIHRPLIANHYLNIHFKLSGQMLFAKNVNNARYKFKIPFTKGSIMPANTTRVIIEFKDKSGLFFNDLRKFGWIKLSKKPLIPKGVDVLSKDFTARYLKGILKTTKRNIKTVLMDQDLVTGIGNIYANDSLFLAKINPLRSADSLVDKEVDTLYKKILQEIDRGIKDKGSSGADEAFILPDGSKGRHQRNFLVYQQEGKLCRRCKKEKIKRIKHNGRSSFYCPRCQTQ